MIGPPVERAVSVNGRCQSNAAPRAPDPSSCATSTTGQLAGPIRSVPLPRTSLTAKVLIAGNGSPATYA
ncbi:MAG TPA: hypothetical protein VIK01_26800, partial [Polyangiaceae bacterium]